jgi:predicted TPR repeat methyltransferase
VWARIGRLREAQGDLDGAVAASERALGMDAAHVEARARLLALRGG